MEDDKKKHLFFLFFKKFAERINGHDFNIYRMERKGIYSLTYTEKDGEFYMIFINCERGDGTNSHHWSYIIQSKEYKPTNRY